MTYSVVSLANSIPDEYPSGGGCRDGRHPQEHAFLCRFQYYDVRHARSKPERNSTGKCAVLCSKIHYL